MSANRAILGGCIAAACLFAASFAHAHGRGTGPAGDDFPQRCAALAGASDPIVGRIESARIGDMILRSASKDMADMPPFPPLMISIGLGGQKFHGLNT